MKHQCVQSRPAACSSIGSLVLSSPVSRAPVLNTVEVGSRISIRPQAILEVVRRRGRSWGLLAQYEEGRLGLTR